MGRDRKPHLLDGGHLEHAVLACRDRGGGLRLHLDGEGLAAGGNPTRSRGREPNSGNPFLVRKQGEGAGLGDAPGGGLARDLDLVLVDDIALVADPHLGRGLRSRGDRDHARRDGDEDSAGQRLELLALEAQVGAAVLAELGPLRVPVPALRALDHGDSPPLLAAAQTGNRIPGASLAPKWRPVKSFLMSP